MDSSFHRFWMTIHRYLGLAAMLFLGFAAITGSLLCFVRPLDAVLNGDLFYQQPVQNPPAVATLVDAFHAHHPEWIVQSFPLSVPNDMRIPVKVQPASSDAAQDVDQLFLARDTGVAVGARSDKPALNRRGAMQWLHDIHYTLLAGTWGRWLMGLMAVLWTIGTIVGVYLTFPSKGAFWKQWKRSWSFSFKSGLGRLMRDMHRSFGLWLLLPLLLLALTSVAMNLFAEGYEPLVDRLFPAPVTDIAPPKDARPSAGRLNFAGAVANARREAPQFEPQWMPASVLYDKADDRIGVTITDDGTVNYRLLGPIYLYFDAKSGRLADVADPYHNNRNLRMIRLLYPIHSGRMGGPLAVALVFVSGLVTFVMCVTGVYVWWKKRAGRVAAQRARKRRSVSAALKADAL